MKFVILEQAEARALILTLNPNHGLSVIIELRSF